MPQEYTVFLRFEVAACYRSLRKSEKEALERFFNFLQKYPFLNGETTERDEIGRTVQVKFLSRFKIVFWADHAVREVKVLRLDRLNRT